MTGRAGSASFFFLLGNTWPQGTESEEQTDALLCAVKEDEGEKVDLESRFWPWR